jgi:hypothetical protein
MKNEFNNLNEYEAEIVDYLKNFCDGIEHAISNEGLARKFMMDTRTMRNLITNLIVNQHIPIGSCSKNHSGIFYCVTDSDFEVAHRELIGRIKQLSRRAKGLRLGYFAKEKQLTLI